MHHYGIERRQLRKHFFAIVVFFLILSAHYRYDPSSLSSSSFGVDAGLASPPIPPTRDQCLYFSDDNGFAQVLKVNQTQANLVLSDLALYNTTNRTDTGEFVATLQNIGYRAAGLTIYKDILYVVSLRLIASYNISDNLKRIGNFVDFAFVPYECLPGGLAAFNDVLYLSCGAFIGSNLTFPVLKFSLRPQDYGSFLSATDYGARTSQVYLYQAGAISNATFLAHDYIANVENVNVTGTFVYFSGGSGIFAIPLDNETPTSNLTELYLLGTIFGRSNVSTANDTSNNFFNGFTWGLDGDLYCTRQYFDSAAGDIIVFDGTTGVYKRTHVPSTPELAGIVGLQLGPTGDFYVTASNDLGGSNIFIYDKDTGQKKGIFYSGSKTNDILPRDFIWGPCPVPPPEDTSTDETLTIILATVLPSLGVPILCLFCILILILIILVVKTIVDGRRRTYIVREDSYDRIEMGRKGKHNFTYREIDPDDLEIGELLGTGAFGKVYKGTYRGAVVAIKTFDQIKLDEADEETLAEIREEAEMMQRVGNHPNVITFVGAITSPDSKGHILHFSLVTEYCPYGSLYDFLIKKKAKVPFIVLLRMMRDIAAGILHLHREKVIHRDIAARNVLVGENHAVFISDFGMARIKEKEVNTTVANVGPVKWMAPECMTHRQYSESSDAFSYGVLLWEMITRKTPWRGMDVSQIIIAVAKKNTRLEIPPDTDPILKSIISSVWRAVPEKRMTMTEIVNKLDNYVNSLAEAYSDISSDEEEGEGGSYHHSYDSNHNSRQSTVSKETAIEMVEFADSSSEEDEGGGYVGFQADHLRPSGKGKEKEKGKGKKHYGEMPDDL